MTNETIKDITTEKERSLEELASINEQLAIKNKQTKTIIKIILGIIIGFLVVGILLFFIGTISFDFSQSEHTVEKIEEIE